MIRPHLFDDIRYSFLQKSSHTDKKLKLAGERIHNNLMLLQTWRGSEDGAVKRDVKLVSTLFMLLGYFSEDVEQMWVSVVVS